jgi:hypothetical protein
MLVQEEEEQEGAAMAAMTALSGTGLHMQLVAEPTKVEKVEIGYARCLNSTSDPRTSYAVFEAHARMSCLEQFPT